MSNCYNLTKAYICNFPAPDSFDKEGLIRICKELNSALFSTSKIAEYKYKNRGHVQFAQFFPKQSKHLIDKIDILILIGRSYGLSAEELDFIINYDIKYRMGDELNNSEEQWKRLAISRCLTARRLATLHQARWLIFRRFRRWTGQRKLPSVRMLHQSADSILKWSVKFLISYFVENAELYVCSHSQSTKRFPTSILKHIIPGAICS